MSTSLGRVVVVLAIVAPLTSAACGDNASPTTTPLAPGPPPAPPPPPPPPPPPDWGPFYRLAREHVETLWTLAFPALYGVHYTPVSTFRGYAMNAYTPCGEMGPWNAYYCPANAGVYYHTPFLDHYFEEVGDLGAAVIIAHEFGHHVSWLLGWVPGYTMSTKQSELQADCLAGAWASAVDERQGLSPERLNAAAITLISAGSPQHTWFDPTIHGTSVQRLKAFADGFRYPPNCTDPWWVGQWPLS